MRRLLLPFLLLLTTGAIATIPPLREAAVAQWRSIAMPLFQRGDATDPYFDAFYAEMMWSLAALGARGVDRERIYARLLETTRESDPALRKAAVDAMARLGGSEIVAPLLYIAEHDASLIVRERAFCALATGGTLLVAERYQAVPGLLAIAESAHSDQQTRDWTYQALKEITLLYGLPPDAGIWRQRLAAVGLLAER